MRAEFLYKQLDHLRELRREAKKAVLKEARKQVAFKRLCAVPGWGRSEWRNSSASSARHIGFELSDNYGLTAGLQ